MAASPCALGVPRDEPVRPPHRRRLRGQRLAVAAGAGRARAVLPRPGGVAPGTGCCPARRRLVRRYDRRGHHAGTHRRRSAEREGSAESTAACATAGPALRHHPAAGLQQHRRRRRRQATAREDGGHRRPARGDRERQGSPLRHRPGRAGRRRDVGHQARHRPGRAVEPSDRPDCVARGVRVAGGRRAAVGVRHLHRRGDHGTGLSAVDVHDDVGVRDVDGVDVRHRVGHRLFTVYSHAVP